MSRAFSARIHLMISPTSVNQTPFRAVSLCAGLVESKRCASLLSVMDATVINLSASSFASGLVMARCHLAMLTAPISSSGERKTAAKWGQTLILTSGQ